MNRSWRCALTPYPLPTAIIDLCPSTVTKPWCCARTSWAKPTASSPCSAASTARSAPWPRACGAPHPSSAPGWSRSWSPTCSFTRAAASTSSPRRNHSAPTAPRSPRTTGCYTAANVMVEAADKITDDDGSLQQYLLLVGGLRSLSPPRTPPQPHPGLLPAARPLGRWLGAELRRLRGHRRSRAALRVRGAAGRRGVRRGGPARLAPARLGDARLAGCAAGRGLERRGVQRGRHPQPGQRCRRRIHAVPPGARPPVAAAVDRTSNPSETLHAPRVRGRVASASERIETR